MIKTSGKSSRVIFIVLRFMRTQKVWRGFLLVWLASFATLSIVMRGMIPFPLPIYLITIAVSALTVNALPYLADRLLADIPGIAPLGRVPYPAVHAWHLYVVRLDTRKLGLGGS